MSLCLFCFNPKEVINVRRSDLEVFVSSVKIRSFSCNFSSYSLLRRLRYLYILMP